MAASIMVKNDLLIRYDNDDKLVLPNLNTSLTNEEVYNSGQAIAGLQSKALKSINKLSKYVMYG